MAILIKIHLPGFCYRDRTSIRYTPAHCCIVTFDLLSSFALHSFLLVRWEPLIRMAV